MIIGRSRLCDTAGTAQLLRGFNDPDRCRTWALVSLLLPNRTCPKREARAARDTQPSSSSDIHLDLVAALAATDGV